MADTVGRGDPVTLTYQVGVDLQAASTVTWLAWTDLSAAARLTKPATVVPGPNGDPSTVTVELTGSDTGGVFTGPLLCRIAATDGLVTTRYPDGGYWTLRVVDLSRPLLIGEASVLAAVGITDPTVTQVQIAREAILAATADLAAYLGCPPVPTAGSVVLGSAWDGRIESLMAGYVRPRDLTYTALPDGTVRLEFVHGYDPDTDPVFGEAVRRYLTYAVMQLPPVVELWRGTVEPLSTRVVRSASAAGQSVTYDRVSPTGDVIGGRVSAGTRQVGVPVLADLDHWRVAGRRASQGQGYQSDPWPMDVAYFTGRW